MAIIVCRGGGMGGRNGSDIDCRMEDHSGSSSSNRSGVVGADDSGSSSSIVFVTDAGDGSGGDGVMVTTKSIVEC